MNEKELQAAVIDLAHLYKWTVAHFRAAQNSSGDWRTPVAADAKGFPDLTLVRGATICFAELKSVRGRLTPEQDMWLTRLEATAADVHVWYPKDWRSGTIDQYLKHG